MSYLSIELSLLISMYLALFVIPKLLVIADRHSLYNKNDVKYSYSFNFCKIAMDMRSFSLNIFIFIIIIASATSCAVLTESQLKMVTNLTVASDTVVVKPKTIFNELSTVRLERGLLYAASLTTAEARGKEINALAEASIVDKQLVNRTDAYVTALNGYLKALRSLSANARWTQYGTEWRGIGRNIDSLILRFNQTELTEMDITVGWAKLSGQYIGYISENYSRARQAKTVKEFVMEGDTLVAACVDGLVELLRKGELEELILNESEGLKSNYEAYLYRIELSGEIPNISYDRTYIELINRIENAKYTRSRCVTALQSLKRAHGKLVKELEKRKKTDYLFEELLELNTLALSLQTMLE